MWIENLLSLAIAVFAVSPLVMMMKRSDLYEAALKRRRKKPFRESFLRPPGYALRQRLWDRFADLVVGLILLMTLSFVALIFSNAFNGTGWLKWLAMAVAVGCILYAHWVAWKLHAVVVEFDRLRLGYDAELMVGQGLNALMRKGYWVFHDLPTDYGNVDHVILTPSAVFAIETKARSKPLHTTENYRLTQKWMNLEFPHGVDAQMLDQTVQQAQVLGKLLSQQVGRIVPVIPVLVLPGWYVVTDRKAPAAALNPKMLPSYVERLQGTPWEPAVQEALATALIKLGTVEGEKGKDEADESN